MPVQVLCTNSACGASISTAGLDWSQPVRCPRCGRIVQPSSIADAKSGPSVTGDPSAQLELADGSIFGRYRILRTLGRGGMGAVYLAEDSRLGRRVALKVPHLPSGASPELLQRFHREARSAALLDHQNLCPIYDVGNIDGIDYLTMAYIEGQSLAALIDRRGALASRQAAGVVRKLALAMQEAHDQGVWHRDLKPANVLIGRKRELVIVDFGLAWHDAGGDPRLTKTGVVLGTPSYMSPEQVSGDLSLIGRASDIYSLGVILYELLTGRLPFEGSMPLVLGQIMVAEVPPPSSLNAEVDGRIESICLKAMSKRVEARQRSMTELAEELGEYLKGGEEPSPVRPELISFNEGDIPRGGETDRLLSRTFGAIVARSGSTGHAGPDSKPVDLEAGMPDRRKRGKRALMIACAPGFLVALIGMILYVRTEEGTLRIELMEGRSNAVVRVDGKRISAEDLGEPLKLPVGEHRLEVESPGFEAGGKQFTIRRGTNPAIRIGLVSLEKPPKDQAQSPKTTKPEIAPPSAATRSINSTPGANSSPVMAPIPETVISGERSKPLFPVFHKAKAPTLDGVIGPDEYASRVCVDFMDDENPGAVVQGGIEDSLDLECTLYTAYTDTALFVGIHVTDDTVIANPQNSERPQLNDSIEIFIDGDNLPGDFSVPRLGDAEGFQLIADTLGNKYSLGLQMDAWNVVGKQLPGGYVMEFMIPLKVIDTKDGPGEVPAGPGSSIRFNLAVTDNDRSSDTQETYTQFWRANEHPESLIAGEKSWVVTLHLEPIGAKEHPNAPTRPSVREAPAGQAPLTSDQILMASGFFPIYLKGDPAPQDWKMYGFGSIREAGEGILVTRGGSGLLAYQGRRLDRFELYLEYQTTAESDRSAIYFGIPNLPIIPDVAEKEAIKVQIFDRGEANLGTGAIAGKKAPDHRSNRPPGSWNTLSVGVRGNQISVSINGVRVNTWSMPVRDGFIGLGNESGSEVRYRNIWLKPVETPGAISSKNRRPMAPARRPSTKR